MRIYTDEYTLFNDCDKETRSKVNEILLQVNGDNLGRDNTKVYTVVNESETFLKREYYLEHISGSRLVKILVDAEFDLIEYKIITLGEY